MCNSLSSYKTVLDARQTILLSRRFNMGRRRHVHLEMWRWSTQSGGEEHGQNSHTEYGPCASRNGCDEAATGANRNASRRTFEWIIQRIKVSRYHLLTWVQTPAAPPPSQSIRSWAKLTPPLRRPFRRNIMMFVIVRRECIVREKGQQRPARRRRRQQPTAEQLCVENCNCDLA